MKVESPAPTPSGRLVSLDAFRGLTIAAMILVNNPGSWSFVYPPLRHAEWHGLTPTDLIFPFFLFIMGVSVALAFSRRRETGESRSRVRLKILRRTLVLFGLGLFLALYPRFDFGAMRIPGVLQRIAICYAIAAWLYLKLGTRSRALFFLMILAAYWAVLMLVPVPGGAAGQLGPHDNLCGYIDRLLMRDFLYRPDFDPEGLLSTLPAAATALLGTLVGDRLRGREPGFRTALFLSGAGAGMMLAGFAIHPFFPVNKSLWTSSYVLVSGGAAMLGLALFHWLLDRSGPAAWARPLRVFGVNPLALYVGSGILVRSLALVKIGGRPFKTYVYQSLLAPWARDYGGSLLYPVLLLLFWLAVLWPLENRAIRIRI
jgi:predicted acyltransferase